MTANASGDRLMNGVLEGGLSIRHVTLLILMNVYKIPNISVS